MFSRQTLISVIFFNPLFESFNYFIYKFFFNFLRLMPYVKCDPFYFLAKKYGFRSRAAFKLIEIDRKYKILNKCKGLIDLCAAPGSWTQVAYKVSPVGSLIIGIDAQKIKPIKNCFFLRADITSPSIIKTVNKLKKFDKRRINIILHDGAPKIGTSWLKDVLVQNELALLALKIGAYTLEKRGTLVSKIFRSEFLHGILYISRCFFEKVLLFKPSASRDSSAEIYLVCKEFKNLKNIDPFFFSFDYIFSFSKVKSYMKKMIPSKTNEDKERKNALMSSIRRGHYNNSYKKILSNIDDEFQCIFGTCLFSKIFDKIIQSTTRYGNDNEAELILKWSQMFLSLQK